MGENDRKFKLWLSFYVSSEQYKEKNLNCKNKGNIFSFLLIFYHLIPRYSFETSEKFLQILFKL